MSVHGPAERKVVLHALHQLAKTAVGKHLYGNKQPVKSRDQRQGHEGGRTIIKDDQKRRHQIAHSLNITHFHVLPHVGAHDVAQLLQVLRRKVPEVAIAPLHVLVNSVQVYGKLVQRFSL